MTKSGIVSMIAVDPEDTTDALSALGVVDDLNGLIKAGEIELVLNDEGVATLWPKGKPANV